MLSPSKRIMALLISIAALSSCSRNTPATPSNPPTPAVNDYQSPGSGVHVTPDSLCWKDGQYYKCSGGSTGGQCDITSQTVATSPTDQTRTTIGVGEEVNLTTTGDGLFVNGDGTMSGAQLTAGDSAGNVTVYTEGRGKICTYNSITFTVVAPSGKYYVHTGGVYHTANRPIVGIQTHVYLQPDDVSFQFIQEQESYDTTENIPAATSVWRCYTSHVPAAGWIQVGPDVVGWGSDVGTDTANSGDCGYPPPFPASQAVDNIPNYYQAGGIKEGPFANVLMESTLDSAGNLKEIKGNASGGTTVTSGNSTY